MYINSSTLPDFQFQPLPKTAVVTLQCTHSL